MASAASPRIHALVSFVLLAATGRTGRSVQGTTGAPWLLRVVAVRVGMSPRVLLASSPTFLRTFPRIHCRWGGCFAAAAAMKAIPTYWAFPCYRCSIHSLPVVPVAGSISSSAKRNAAKQKPYQDTAGQGRARRRTFPQAVARRCFSLTRGRHDRCVAQYSPLG